jgi:hypothetical protein
MSDYVYDELNREARIGGMGEAKDYAVALIDLSDFDTRKPQIADALWEAATTLGLFQLTGHGIPMDQIEEAFALSEAFFALPEEAKSALPLRPGTNSGWEFKAQVRPSTGTAGPERKLPDHASADGEGLWPEPSRDGGLPPQDAGLRTRQLGSRDEGPFMLRR